MTVDTILRYFLLNVPCVASSYLNLILQRCGIILMQTLSTFLLGSMAKMPRALNFALGTAILASTATWTYALITSYQPPEPISVGICVVLELPWFFYVPVIADITIALVTLVVLGLWIWGEMLRQTSKLKEVLKRSEVRNFVVAMIIDVVVLSLTTIQVGRPNFTKLPYDVYWILTVHLITKSWLCHLKKQGNRTHMLFDQHAFTTHMGSDSTIVTSTASPVTSGKRSRLQRKWRVATARMREGSTVLSVGQVTNVGTMEEWSESR